MKKQKTIDLRKEWVGALLRQTIDGVGSLVASGALVPPIKQEKPSCHNANDAAPTKFATVTPTRNFRRSQWNENENKQNIWKQEENQNKQNIAEK